MLLEFFWTKGSPPALAPVVVDGIVARVKPVLIALLALVVAAGCGKNEPEASPDTPLSDTQTQPSTVDKPIVNSIGMKLTFIPAGEFRMGSPDSDNEASVNEKPQHLVKIHAAVLSGRLRGDSGAVRVRDGTEPE